MVEYADGNFEQIGVSMFVLKFKTESKMNWLKKLKENLAKLGLNDEQLQEALKEIPKEAETGNSDNNQNNTQSNNDPSVNRSPAATGGGTQQTPPAFSVDPEKFEYMYNSMVKAENERKENETRALKENAAKSVAEAIKEGRFTEAQKDLLLGLAEKAPEDFSKFVAANPPRKEFVGGDKKDNQTPAVTGNPLFNKIVEFAGIQQTGQKN